MVSFFDLIPSILKLAPLKISQLLDMYIDYMASWLERGICYGSLSEYKRNIRVRGNLGQVLHAKPKGNKISMLREKKEMEIKLVCWEREKKREGTLNIVNNKEVMTCTHQAYRI